MFGSEYHKGPLKEGCGCKHHQIGYIIMPKTIGTQLLNSTFPIVTRVKRFILPPILKQFVYHKAPEGSMIMW